LEKWGAFGCKITVLVFPVYMVKHSLPEIRKRVF
jgi:hypothetical protein